MIEKSKFLRGEQNEETINPYGGWRKGKLTNYPISSEARVDSAFDLPELYTGAVEDGILTDVPLKRP